MTYFEVNDSNRDDFSSRLLAFEKEFIYPLGNDRFKISHGTNYFKFFDNIGEVIYAGYTKDNHIAIVVCIIKRVINKECIYYICDLKKKKGYSSSLTKSLTDTLYKKYNLENKRIYAVSMNPFKRENTVAKVWNRTFQHHFKSDKTINLYSLNLDTFLKIREVLEEKGTLSSISTRGVKDIILQSNKLKLPLYHICFNKKENKNIEMDKEGMYMFCLLSDHILNKKLESLGVEINSKATILQRNMDDNNFDFINTSEI